MGVLDYAVPGLNIVSGLAGVFGASAARKAAEEARQRALVQMSQQLSQEEQQTQGNNARALASYTGDLNGALASEGRALGDANSGAGVWNSSAVAGTLANQGAANAQATAGYAADLGSRLAQLRAQNRQYLAGLQFNSAQGDLNYARDQYGNTMSGIAGALQSLPGLMKPRPTGYSSGPNLTGMNDTANVILGRNTQKALTNMGAVDPATTQFAPGAGSGGTGFMPVGPVGAFTPQRPYRPLFAGGN